MEIADSQLGEELLLLLPPQGQLVACLCRAESGQVLLQPANRCKASRFELPSRSS